MRGRWAGPLLLATAVLYLLTLGALRERLPAVPNAMWVATLVALLVIGGAGVGGAIPVFRPRLRRHQIAGRVGVLGGSVAIAVGVLSVRAEAETWTDGARAAGALALCAGLALLPFGAAVLCRAGRLGNAPAASSSERPFPPPTP